MGGEVSYDAGLSDTGPSSDGSGGSTGDVGLTHLTDATLTRVTAQFLGRPPVPARDRPTGRRGHLAAVGFTRGLGP